MNILGPIVVPLQSARAYSALIAIALALLVLGGCVEEPSRSGEAPQQPIIIDQVTAPPPVYLTNSAPASISVTGAPGKTGAWTIAAPAGTFTPASGTVTTDGNGTGFISTTYTAPGTTTTSSLTATFTLTRDTGYTASADVPITLNTPAMGIGTVSMPASINLSQTTPTAFTQPGAVSLAFTGVSGFSGTWALTPPAGGGSFSPATGTVIFDGTGNATVSGIAYTAPPALPGGSTAISHQVSISAPWGTVTQNVPMTLVVPTIAVGNPSVPSGMLLSQISPAVSQTGTVSIPVTGTTGYSATWTLTAAANGGSFSPSSGTITFAGGVATINTTYNTSTVGTGTSVTYNHALSVAGQWNTAPQTVSTVLTVPTVAISSTSSPANVYLARTTLISGTVSGVAGYSANVTGSSSVGGTFTTQLVTFDGTGSATFGITYTAPSSGGGGAAPLSVVAQDVGVWNAATSSALATSVDPPTVTVASATVTPVNLVTMAAVPVTVNLTGTPGFTVNCALPAPVNGTFGVISGCGLLDANGNGSFTTTFTPGASISWGSHVQTPNLTIIDTNQVYTSTFSIGTTIPVAVFANGTYVDYVPGAAGSEGSNLSASLTAEGFTVTTFTGILDTDFTAALANQAVLVIPELEVADLNAALSAAARTVIQNWVSSGKTLVVAGEVSGRDASLLNGIFGWTLAHAQMVTAVSNGVATYSNSYHSMGEALPLDAAAAAGTIFATAPTSLSGNNGTYPLAPTSVAAVPGGRSIYTSTIAYSGTDSITLAPYAGTVQGTDLAYFPVSLGRVVWLGWDWFLAAPTGTANGGWLGVLSSIVVAAEAGTL